MRTSLERSEERRQFLDKLRGLSPRSVSAFHGPEGIGKTWLLWKIREDIVAAPGLITLEAVLDFYAPERREPAEALLHLRRKLAVSGAARRVHLPFRAFDLAVCAYYQTRYGGSRAKALSIEIATLSDDLVRKVIRGAGDFTGQVVPIGGGYLKQAVDAGLAEAKAQEAAKKSRSAEWLLKLPEATEQELEEMLPTLFGVDVAEHLEAHPEHRVVLLLDNYDQLWGDREADHLDRGRSDLDQWVRELAAQAVGSAIAVFGRNPIEWSGASHTELPALSQGIRLRFSRNGASPTLSSRPSSPSMRTGIRYGSI